MKKAPSLESVDRDMDTAFDSLYVLNTTVQAIVESMPPGMALRVVPRMDAVIYTLHQELNPVGQFHRSVLIRWRNIAAHVAGLPPMQLDA